MLVEAVRDELGDGPDLEPLEHLALGLAVHVLELVVPPPKGPRVPLRQRCREGADAPARPRERSIYALAGHAQAARAALAAEGTVGPRHGVVVLRLAPQRPDVPVEEQNRRVPRGSSRSSVGGSGVWGG